MFLYLAPSFTTRNYFGNNSFVQKIVNFRSRTKILSLFKKIFTIVKSCAKCHDSWPMTCNCQKHKLHKSAFHFFKFLSKINLGKNSLFMFCFQPKIPHRVFYLQIFEIRTQVYTLHDVVTFNFSTDPLYHPSKFIGTAYVCHACEAGYSRTQQRQTDFTPNLHTLPK